MRKKWQCKHGRFAYEYCAECQEPAPPAQEQRKADFMAGAGAIHTSKGWRFDVPGYSDTTMAEAFAAYLAQPPDAEVKHGKG
jgi:hypothetical protein